MSKLLLGVLLGALLGLIDGLSAWFYPAVRDQIVGIVLGSTFKGLVTGVVAGFIARKWHSLPLGILVGFAVGCLLSFLVALGGDEHGNHYYVEIMLPGSVLGAIVGFATQRWGKAPARVAT